MVKRLRFRVATEIWFVGFRGKKACQVWDQGARKGQRVSGLGIGDNCQYSRPTVWQHDPSQFFMSDAQSPKGPST